MIVYGERVYPCASVDVARDVLGCVARSRAARHEDGIARHAEVAAALLRAGELVQALDDEAQRGADASPHTHASARRLLDRAADALVASYDHDFGAPLEPLADAARALEQAPLAAGTSKRGEGFCFYALYPEAYVEAARRALERVGRASWIVVGIRSIGTALGAVVASTLRAAGLDVLAFTVRPGGHPFARELALERSLASAIANAPSARIAVVDEGPGLSGSSFGCVLDALECAGVTRDRIDVFPSHGGELGPRASERHRERWRTLRRHVVTFEELTQSGKPLALARLLGIAKPTAIDELSAGRWRMRLGLSGAERPPVNAMQERRKYVAGDRLFSFVGLGTHGEEACARGRTLAAEGWTPAVHALRYGFLETAFCEGARPLSASPRGGEDRLPLATTAARYIARRTALFPSARRDLGADPRALHAMARFNTEALLGPEAAALVDAFEADLPRLVDASAPSFTDNRLHAWEWLVTPGGALLKTDAVDHASAHDLVGCQDVAWDVAGGVVELARDEATRQALVRRVEAETGRSIAPRLPFYETAYLAFQAGAFAMAALGNQAFDAGEAVLAQNAARRYADKLRELLYARRR
jgi:hypothetical protein